MAHRYRILHGQEFREPDGTLKGPGQEIELEDDVAARYAGNLEKIEPAPEPAATAESAGAPAASAASTVDHDDDQAH